MELEIVCTLRFFSSNWQNTEKWYLVSIQYFLLRTLTNNSSPCPVLEIRQADLPSLTGRNYSFEHLSQAGRTESVGCQRGPHKLMAQLVTLLKTCQPGPQVLPGQVANGIFGTSFLKPHFLSVAFSGIITC